MYLLLLNYYKSNNIYKNRNSNRSTISRPMGTNYGKQKKENNKKNFKKKTYITIRTYYHLPAWN